MAADGSIIFDTGLDNSKLQKDLVKIKKDIEKLETSVTAQKAKKSPLVQQAQALEQKMKAARAEVQRYREAWRSGVSGADKDQALAIAQVQQMEAQYAKVVTQIDKIDDKLLPAYKSLDEMKESAGGIEQRLAQAGVNIEKMDRATKKANKSAGKFALRIKEVVRSALVFTLITQALAKFREWMGKVIRTNTEATAAVARLKGALLTMAQPLLNIIIPAFTTFVNILTDIVAVIAKIVSVLFGSTVEKSAEAAEELYNEADAINGVGGAAKKAAKTIAAFDEINKLSGDAGGTNGADGDLSTIKPDFSLFDTKMYKEKLDEIATYVAGSLLALGAILAFSGVNIPLGIALMAVGAVGLATVISTNWGIMPTLVKNALSTIFLILGPMLFVFGVIFALSGANLALGIGLMLAGATAMGSGVALNWEAITTNVASAVTAIMFLMGSSLLVLGALFAFSGVNVGLGIGLMLSGAVALGSAAALNWGSCGEKTKQVVSELLAIMGTALLGLGAMFAFSGANLPLGIGLMIAGAVSLGSAAALNWGAIQSALENPIAQITAFVSGALLVLGIILAMSGVSLPLGIALITAGAGGLVSVGALDWDAILECLQGAWNDIVGWWNRDAAKFFTLEYWQGLGKNMLDGLFGGLSSVGSKISEWGTGFIDGVCNFFGIHSPSTEFESLGKYMMLGMENGIDDHSELVLTMFSVLLSKMLFETQNTTGEMQALFAIFLLYLMGEFRDGWANSWLYFQESSRRSIQSIKNEIDTLNAKLASIERNITITITTVYKTVGSKSSGSSSGSASSRSAAARVAAMPATLRAVPMATGGVIPPNREFLALYGDQRSGNNIEAPESLLRKIVREESAGGNSQLLQAILEAIKAGKVVMLDRDQIGRVVYDTYNREDRRVGVRLAGV